MPCTGRGAVREARRRAVPLASSGSEGGRLPALRSAAVTQASERRRRLHRVPLDGKPLVELAGAANFAIDSGSLGDYGTQYGPLFSGPNPLCPGPWHRQRQPLGRPHPDQPGLRHLPQREARHRRRRRGQGPEAVVVGPGGAGARHHPATVWTRRSRRSPTPRKPPSTTATATCSSTRTRPAPNDVVLQTTYDEWQDYVAFYDAGANADGIPGFKARYSNLDTFANPNDSALGCSDCHMPVEAKDDRNAPVVDHAPGCSPDPSASTTRTPSSAWTTTSTRRSTRATASRPTRSTRPWPSARR